MHTIGIPVVIRASGDSIANIMDRLGGKTPKSITVKMEATHSGIVNGNHFFYPEESLRDAAKTFVSPNNAPVTIEHAEDSPIVGRVLESKYVSYRRRSYIRGKSVGDDVPKIRDFVRNVQTGPSYKGMGHIELIAKITDSDTIQKILSGEYAGVSVGGKTSNAFCSVCATDKKVKSCSHERGKIYDGRRAFLIAGDIVFDHVTYTAIPADKNALSTTIKDSGDVGTFLEILDFELTEENSMKLKFEEISGQWNAVEKHASELGVPALSISDSQELQPSDFLFDEEKTFPLVDKLSMAVIADFIQNKVEDSEDARTALSVIEDKLKDQTEDSYQKIIEDAVAEAKAAEVKDSKDEEVQTEEGKVFASVDDTFVAKIVDALAERLQVHEGFAGRRIKALTQDLKVAREEAAALKADIKDHLVDRICHIEEIQDSAKIEQLKSRSIESLKDKLQDAQERLASASKDEDKQEESIKDSQEGVKAPLEENSVSPDTIADSVVDEASDEPKEEDKGSEDAPVVLSDSEVRKQYAIIAKKDGLWAAKAWLKSQQSAGLISDSFTFQS